ncbi:hypothetical protein [Luteimonas sp. e5]
MAAVQILVTIASLVFGLWLGRVVQSGLRTGRIRHTDSTQSASRAGEPAKYWAFILLFSAISFMALVTAARLLLILFSRA